jgi:hypothetical protein
MNPLDDQSLDLSLRVALANAALAYANALVEEWSPEANADREAALEELRRIARVVKVARRVKVAA